jgi:hypothetical protein
MVSPPEGGRISVGSQQHLPQFLWNRADTAPQLYCSVLKAECLRQSTTDHSHNENAVCRSSPCRAAASTPHRTVPTINASCLKCLGRCAVEQCLGISLLNTQRFNPSTRNGTASLLRIIQDCNRAVQKCRSLPQLATLLPTTIHPNG